MGSASAICAPKSTALPTRITKPGSIFKTIVAMAALESGLDPEDASMSTQSAGSQRSICGRQSHFQRHGPARRLTISASALKLSSNSYFITIGLRIGPERIIARWASACTSASATGLPHRARKPRAFSRACERLSTDWTRRRHRQHLHRPRPGLAVTPLANGGADRRPLPTAARSCGRAWWTGSSRADPAWASRR